MSIRLARRHCEPKYRPSRLRLASSPSSTCAVITGWLKLRDTRYGTLNVCAFICHILRFIERLDIARKTAYVLFSCK